jgi:alkylhydroperoxidase family enzyme
MLVRITRQHSFELASDVRVTALAPGLVKTRLAAALWEGPAEDRIVAHVPLRRLGRPDDIATAAPFLASDAASWVTGQTSGHTAMSHFDPLSRQVLVTGNVPRGKEGGAMAHVPLHDYPRGLVSRVAASYTKHRFGQMVEPTAAASHHAGVLVAMGSLETAAQFGWKKLDPTLRWLALQATGTRIGCSWCVDYGYYEGLVGGIDPAKVRAVANWRASDLFDARERVVLEYAEVATGCPAEVSDELAGRVRSHFSDAEFVELAAWVAQENFRSRFNAGLGLRSQGFSDNCEIPVRTVSADAIT